MGEVGREGGGGSGRKPEYAEKTPTACAKLVSHTGGENSPLLHEDLTFCRRQNAPCLTI